MIDVVEETFDVQVQHPGIPPAALARSSDRLVRRPARPVAIGVRVEQRINLRFQTLLDYHLGHSVGHRRHG